VPFTATRWLRESIDDRAFCDYVQRAGSHLPSPRTLMRFALSSANPETLVGDKHDHRDVRGDRRVKAALGKTGVRYGWNPRCSTRTTWRWPCGFLAMRPGRASRRTTGACGPLRITADCLDRQVSCYGQSPLWGAVLGCTPPSRLTCTFDRICAAQRQRRAAFEGAFRALNVRYQPAPPSTPPGEGGRPRCCDRRDGG
jgi:hypothetical protein